VTVIGIDERRQTGSLQSSASPAMSANDVPHRLDEALRELERLRAENERLRTLLALAQEARAVIDANKRVRDRPDARAAPDAAAAAKVALFRSMFRGREDLYALRWENAGSGRSGYVPATGTGGRRPARRRICR
jgi:hypothetical protein